MLTPDETQALEVACAIECRRERLYAEADELQTPIAARLLAEIAAMPTGGSYSREGMRKVMMAIEQFPQGYHRSELRTALNMKGPWSP